MAEKFAITAELQLLLDSKVDSQISNLKKKIESSGAEIPVTIRENIKEELDKLKREFRDKTLDFKVGISDTSLRNFYKELNAIFNTAEKSRRRIGLKVGLDNSSLKEFYKELNVVFESSARSKRRVKLGVELDRQSLQQFYNEINTIFNSARGSRRRISIFAELNEPSIKRIYQELRAVYNSFQKPISLKVDVSNNNDIQRLKDSIAAINSKTVSLNLKVRKDLGAILQGVGIGLADLDAKVAAFSVDNLDRIAVSLATLSSIGKRKLSFDLSIKDAKAADALSASVDKVSSSFDKAGLSAGNFKVRLQEIIGLVGGLKQSVSGLNFQNITNANKALNNIGKQKNTINQLGKSIDDASDGLFDLGVQSAVTLKRFAAYTLITAGFFRLSFAIRNAVGEFIEFDKQLTTIRQVTKASKNTTAELGDEVSRLSRLYGTSSQEILNQSQVLAQAGFNTKETTIALEALAKASIAPTFEDINDTTEATIALLAQFGGNVENLEQNLSSINSVAAAFAVEADDLTTAIQKAGGGFAAAGGSLEELIALFTSVRSTTRESADTIATGFRTIFTRLQRPRTAKFLEDFGVTIRATAEDAKRLSINIGDFVGPFEAIRRIAEATSQLGSTADPRFAQIVEELGGFRQINKVIPLLREQAKAEDALRIAISQRNSLTKDAEIAQESYANQLEKVRQEFLAFIREVADDRDIKELVTLFLDLTKAALRLATSLKDLAPIGLGLGAVFGSRAASTIFQGFSSKVVGRNSGGFVPGRGPNKDTVPAILTGGEYVIRRSAADFYGPTFLNAINNKKVFDKSIAFANSGGFIGYNRGGLVGYQSGGVVPRTSVSLGAGLLTAGVLRSNGGFDFINDLDEEFNGLVSSVAGAGIAIILFRKLINSSSELFSDINTNLNQTQKSIKSFGNITQKRSEFDERQFIPSSSNIPPSKPRQQIALPVLTQREVEAAAINDINTRTTEARRERNLSTSSAIVEIPNVEKEFKNTTEALKANQEALNSAQRQEELNRRRSQAATQTQRLRGNLTNQKQDLTRIRQDINAPGRTREELELLRTSEDAKIKEIRKTQSEITKISKVPAPGPSRRDEINRLQDERSTLIRRQRLQGGNLANLRQRANLPSLVRDDLVNARKFGSFEGRQERKNQAETTNRIQRFVDNNPNLGLNRRQRFTRSAGRSVSNLFRRDNQRTPESLQRAAALAGTIGIAGTVIGNNISRSSLRTEDNEGSVAGSVLGGALSTGSQGAAIGAAVGSIIPVIGTAIGTAVGGLGGAAIGAIQGLTEFENSVKRFNANNSLGELETIFNNFSQGNTDASVSAQNFVRNLSNIQNILQGTTNSSVREDINSGLQNNATNINSFIGEIAKGSSTFEDFSDQINSGTQAFVANLLNIPLKDFKASIERTISSNNKYNSEQEASILAVQEFNTRIRSVRDFQNAFAKATSSINTFSNNLESFVAGGVGTTTIQTNLPERLSNLDSLDSGTSRETSAFLAQFGSIGQNLAKQNEDIAKITQALPNILLDLRSQSAFSSEGDLETRLEAALGNLNLGSNEAVNLVTSRFDELLGEDFKDSNFFKALQKDFPKALSDLTSSLEVIPNTIADAASIANNELNKFSQGLANARALNDKIFQGQLKTFDNVNTLITSRANFSGRSPDRALIQNATRRQEFVTGGRNTRQLFSDIFSSRQRIQNLDAAIANPTNQTQETLANLGVNIPGDPRFVNASIEQNALPIQQALISERNKEQAALEKTTRALNFLANSTDKLSTLQNRLNSLQSERSARRSIAERFVSGGTTERIQILRTQENVETARRLGSVDRFAQEDRAAIIDYLNQLPTQENRDLLSKILSNDAGVLGSAFSNSGEPSQEEQRVQQQIEAQIKQQQQAQQALNKILVNDRNQFYNQLNQNFQGFLSDLRTLLASQQQQETVRQARNVFTERGTTQRQLNIRTNIESRFGSSAIENFARIRENANQLQNNQINDFSGSLRELSALRSDGGFSGLGSQQDLDSFLARALAPLSQDTRENITTRLSDRPIFNEGGELSLSAAASELQTILKNALLESNLERRNLLNERNDLASAVGSEENRVAIANSQDLPKLIELLNKSGGTEKTTQELISTLNTLNRQFESFPEKIRNSLLNQRPAKFNTGGFVPGTGNSDTVPALLTPGEFVLSKPAVQNIGVSTLQKANSGAKKFQDGGLVTPTQSIINIEGIDNFRRAVNALGTNLNSLSDVLSSIPSEITMVGRHTLDVNINGAQAFANMEQAFKKYVQAQITNSINAMLKNKFPEAGNFDG